MVKSPANVPNSDPGLKSALADAIAHYREGRLAEAERLCRDFLQRTGGNQHLYNTLGVVLRAQGRAGDAATAYREAIKLAPENAAAWSNLSNALNELELLDEALEAGQRALNLDPINATFQDNLAKVETKIRKLPTKPSAGITLRKGHAHVGPTGRKARSRRPHQRPKVLFISHEASRTGAPILLLTFLRWVKANADIDFEILVKGHSDWRAGKKEQVELVPDFEALAPTMIWYQKAGNIIDLEHVRQLKDRISRSNFDLVFSNTICNGEILDALRPIINCPFVSYVHELEYQIRCTPSKHVASVKKHTTHYVAGSHIVKRNLNKSQGIPEDRIDVVHSFIDIADHQPDFAPAEIRRQLGIAPDAYVINACATVEWRKAPEMFILLANAVRRRRVSQPVHFVWVGNPLTLNFVEIQYDISRMALNDCVQFIGARPNFRDYIAAADVFALMSREDPFPLVVLEAALLRRPILCFDRAGGSGEFVEQDCGFVVPYLDIEAMADKTVELLKSPRLRESLGKRGSEKVRQRHDASVGSSQLWKIINSILNPAQSIGI